MQGKTRVRIVPAAIAEEDLDGKNNIAVTVERNKQVVSSEDNLPIENIPVQTVVNSQASVTIDNTIATKKDSVEQLGETKAAIAIAD
jgi:hypothetical protein